MESNVGKWDGWYKGMTEKDIGAFRYGESVTYKMAAEFLSDVSEVEDWGCGSGGFKRYCKPKYIGIDGSRTPFADKIEDLCLYRSKVEGIMMRGVLEHNYEWEKILDGAVGSFTKKFCLVLFTPFSEETHQIAHNKAHGVDVPDLSFRREDIERHLAGLDFRTVTLNTGTGYGVEHVYFVSKP